MISFTFTKFLNLSQNIESFFNNTLNNCKHKEFLLIYFLAGWFARKGKDNLTGVCIKNGRVVPLATLHYIFLVCLPSNRFGGEFIFSWSSRDVWSTKKEATDTIDENDIYQHNNVQIITVFNCPTFYFCLFCPYRQHANLKFSKFKCLHFSFFNLPVSGQI